MNIKQIIKTVVRAVMTVVAIRSTEAQYTMSVVCPTTNLERGDLPISGNYFTERGLFVEGNSAIIDDIAWSVSSAVGSPSSRISANVPYYLMDHANEIREEVKIMESINMNVFVPINSVPTTPLDFSGRIECTYQTNQTSTKHEPQSIIPRFTLQAEPCAIYHDFTAEYGSDFSAFSKTGYLLKQYGTPQKIKKSKSFRKYTCNSQQPKDCKVMATFGDCTKKPIAGFFKTENKQPQIKQAVKSSACLVL